MTQTQAIFSADDLTALIGFEVDSAKAEMVEKIVWGWLRPVLDVAERPDTVSDELFSWALELGVIAYNNPGGLSSRQFGDVAEEYSSERRDEILENVSTGGTGPVPKPRGNFPSAPCYPDAAFGSRYRR